MSPLSHSSTASMTPRNRSELSALAGGLRDFGLMDSSFEEILAINLLFRHNPISPILVPFTDRFDGHFFRRTFG